MENEEKVVDEQQSENGGISFKELLFIIKKHLLVIIGIVVLFTAGGYGYSKLQAPVYQSSGTMLVSYDPSNGTGNQSTASSYYAFASYISDTYVVFIKENAVLEKVSEEVNLPIKTIKNNLTVSNNSLILTISYTNSDPDKAKEVTDSVIKNAKEIANVEENGTAKYPLLKGNLSDLSSATDGKRVSKTAKNMVIFFAIGLVVSFIYVLLKEILSNKFKSSEEVERILGVPVLAGIPDYEFDDEKKGAKK